MRKSLYSLVLPAAIAALALALPGCGGGGGGGGGAAATPDAGITPTTPDTGTTPDTPTTPGTGTTPDTPTTPGTGTTPDTPTPPVTPDPLSNDLTPSCTGSNCSATSATVYSGSGTGIWNKTNTGTAPIDVKVAIGNISKKDVTMILTNETATDVALPAVAMSSVLNPSAMAAKASAGVLPGEKNQVAATIDEFNKNGWKSAPLVRVDGAASAPSARKASAMAMSVLPGAIGEIRSFTHADGKAHSTTLQRQVTMPDGVTIQFWVETAEYTPTKMTAALLDPMVTSFTKTGGTYQMLTDIGGPIWGGHPYGNLIPGSSKVLDIVMVNFDDNRRPFGMVGYFYSLNNFTKAQYPASNESLSLYIDTETVYLGGDRGAKAAKMILAHEGMHLSNFYRRSISMGPTYQYDLWMEEMTAMLMEDAASNMVDSTYNSIRDERVPNFLSSASSTCSLLDFVGLGATCDSYSVSGSFGGYMMRQMGIPFFKNLLNRPVADSQGVLNAAIQAFHPGSSIGQELRKFAVATLPAASNAAAPAGFGYPARTDGVYTMAAIDPKADAALRVLPSTSPSVLSAYSSFPVVQKAVTGNFVKTVRVPAGVTLSVVVADR